jgi:phosphoribosylglycinamide formyltransferase-1
VHYVEGDYDTGKIIAQTRIEVRPDDTVGGLEARVKRCERELLLDALRTLAREHSAIEPDH